MEKIKAPKFKVRINGKYHNVNEYELRHLQVDVARGTYSNVIVRDIYNKKAIIQKDGSLSEDLYGLHILTDFKFLLLKLKNN